MIITILIILQVVIFFILIIGFRRVMTKNVTLATQHLEELSKEYVKKEEELNNRMKEMEKRAKEIIKQAEEEARSMREKIIKEAEEEKEKIIDDARRQGDEIIKQAEKARDSLISEIEEKIEQEAFNKACDLLDEVLPEEFKKGIHNFWIEELVNSGFEELANLHLPEDMKEIKIISAFPLTEEQRRILGERLKEILKKDFDIKEEINSKIVAGVIVSVGNLILDGSLKNRIKKSN